nr:blocked early in transport 1 [Hymenolepis microstoma]
MQSSDHILELENNRRAEDLSVKLSLLKSFAREIRGEAKEQNQFLSTVQNAADSAGSMLSRTVGRIVGMPANRRNNRKILCLTVAVFLFVFVIYSMIRLLSG